MKKNKVYTKHNPTKLDDALNSLKTKWRGKEFKCYQRACTKYGVAEETYPGAAEDHVNFGVDPDPSLLEDAAREFIFRFLEPLRSSFTPPIIGARMDYAQMLVFILALFKKHFGATWPLKVRFVMLPRSDGSMQWEPGILDMLLRLPAMEAFFHIIRSCLFWCSVSFSVLGAKTVLFSVQIMSLSVHILSYSVKMVSFLVSK